MVGGKIYQEYMKVENAKLAAAGAPRAAETAETRAAGLSQQPIIRNPGATSVPILYPRSLLDFVSGVAERSGAGDMTVLGMHRHFDGGRRPYVDPRYE